MEFNPKKGDLMRLAEAFEKLDQLYESAEKFLTEDEWKPRAELIAELKSLGYTYYNFDKRSDRELYNMLKKNKEKLETEKALAELERTKPKPKPRCDDCGTLLADSGICPKCYDGAEDLEEKLKESIESFKELINKKGCVIKTRHTNGSTRYWASPGLSIKNAVEIDLQTAKQLVQDLDLKYNNQYSNNLIAFYTNI